MPEKDPVDWSKIITPEAIAYAESVGKRLEVYQEFCDLLVAAEHVMADPEWVAKAQATMVTVHFPRDRKWGMPPHLGMPEQCEREECRQKALADV
jgi:hypothetical protein